MKKSNYKFIRNLLIGSFIINLALSLGIFSYMIYKNHKYNELWLEQSKLDVLLTTPNSSNTDNGGIDRNAPSY